MNEVTEGSINHAPSVAAQARSMARARVLVSCDKLETGYDDPALALIFVDRRYHSASRIVQTLGRINRSSRGKHTARGAFGCIDFVNDKEHVLRACAKFWGAVGASAIAGGDTAAVPSSCALVSSSESDDDSGKDSGEDYHDEG